MSLTHSEHLKLKVGLVGSVLDRASEAFWTSPRLEELFPDYLFRLYGSVRASVPLMRTARARAVELAPGCPVARALVPYLDDHIEEELGHDEWLLDDMEALGFERADVVGRPASPDVAEMVGTYYYWVLHGHPVALLSYFSVVEGNPVRTDTLDRVAATTSIPREALRCIYRHAELDPHHSEEVDRLIDHLPLTAEQAALLETSALTVVEQLSLILRDLVRPRSVALPVH